MRRRPRVLLIAEAANPEWSSVPLVGWSLCRALSDVVDAHVITQVRNRAAIERAGWVEGVEFTALDSEAVARPTYRLGAALRKVTGMGWTATTAFAAPPYYYFEQLVWRHFGEEIATRRFDVVHRITPLTPTIPSLLAHRCRVACVPFVWGPLNGGVAWPREFLNVRRQEGESLSRLRGMHRLLPGYRASRRDAAAIAVGSRATWDQMAGYHDKCVYIPENGIDPVRFVGTARPPPLPLRVAFAGRLVPYKGADMLLEATSAEIRAGRITVDIIGDGPQREALQTLIQAEGLTRGVALHGWMAHSKVHEVLGRCHVLGFPSVREFGGAVVLEAMALGVVPVVVDYAGPGELVTDATGYRVPLGTRHEVVERLRGLLGALASDPSGLPVLADRSRRRVQEKFTWEAKARQLLEVYAWVLGRRPKPDFGMPFSDPSPHDDRRSQAT